MLDITPADHDDNEAIFRPIRSRRGEVFEHSETGRDVRPVKVGEALLGYRQVKINIGGPYHHLKGRLREIEKLIRHRHGTIIPETDDAVIYAEVIAELMIVQYRDKIETIFPAWCARWVPWADQKFIDQIYDGLPSRFTPLGADQIGKRLHVSYAERCELDLRTIGAFDVSKRERTKRQKIKRRATDRLKKEAVRRAQGKPTRAEYLANSKTQTAPWLALGISRRTWERRQNLGKTAQIAV